MKPELKPYLGNSVCIAVSGGKDSMALLHYFASHGAEYSIALSALHCDHGMRESSASDAEFVRAQCAAMGVPLLIFRWDESVKTETTARAWRLRCYAAARLAEGDRGDVRPVYAPAEGWKGADLVATAHHRNDNAETVLFRLARGTALAGMRGISDDNSPTVHPMIDVSREEIDEYIERNRIGYVVDETNFQTDYTRNKLRRNVLPALEEAVPGASASIARFARLAREDEDYFTRLIDRLALVKRTDGGVEIGFCEERAVFKRAAVKSLALLGGARDYTAEHAENLYLLQGKENGKKFEFLQFTAFKEQGKIVLCLREELADGGERAFSCPFEGFGVRISPYEIDPKAGEKILCFDPSAVPAGAVVRFRREGDVFRKYGGGTKSLGDYFTDLKIPVRLRGKIPLIAVGNRILAVCGVEISEEIKVTQNTARTARIACKNYKSEE